MTFSYYCVHPDDCGGYDHEDRGVPPLDDEDMLFHDPECDFDAYAEELHEEVADLEMMLALRESELHHLNSLMGAA